jgi:hypothetical protein
MQVVESAAMSNMTSAEGYHAIVSLIQREKDPSLCWQKLLTLTRQSGTHRLARPSMWRRKSHLSLIS